MKVGLYIGDISPHGGGYTFVIQLLSALRYMRKDCKHELIICHDGDAQSIVRMFPEFPCISLEREKVNTIKTGERILELAPILVQKAYARLRPRVTWQDRIFTRSGIQFIVCMLPWKLLSMEIPFSIMIWDLQHRNNPWFPEVSQLQEWNYREARSTAARRASLIYTGTEQGRREVASYYQVPLERIKVLPFGTPVFALEGANRPMTLGFFDKLGLPPEYIFYPAQFWPHKNHVLVLEACRILHDTIGWKPAVVFSGSNHGNLDYVREYARRLGLEDHVKFLGFVERTDLVDLYKGAFCLAFPTFCGPDNLPPLEAFALGCPVVASEVPGAREQLGDAAILIPPTDERALAQALLNLRDKETRECLVRAGHKRAMLNGWEQYARGFFESLDEFAAIRRAWE